MEDSSASCTVWDNDRRDCVIRYAQRADVSVQSVCFIPHLTVHLSASSPSHSPLIMREKYTQCYPAHFLEAGNQRPIPFSLLAHSAGMKKFVATGGAISMDPFVCVSCLCPSILSTYERYHFWGLDYPDSTPPVLPLLLQLSCSPLGVSKRNGANLLPHLLLSTPFHTAWRDRERERERGGIH